MAGDYSQQAQLLLSQRQATGLPPAGQLLILRTDSRDPGRGEDFLSLLRQLAGLSEPLAGDVKRISAHHWIGHTNGLKAHETPRTHLQHWARVWGSDAEVGAVLERLGMTRPANVPCRMLSAGQKRRTALARLLLQPRDLWLLDEPFNALDTEGQSKLAEMIESHRAEGGAVIAALHGAAPVKASREVEL